MATSAGETVPLYQEQLFAHEMDPIAAFDERRASDGSTRAHWLETEAYFRELGPDEIQRRWGQARKVLHDNGAAYSQYSEAGSSLRPWELNPVPLRIPEGEWKEIEAGIKQRGRLLNALLEDIYGPQDCLRSGLVPWPIVHGNPSFLRPCHGVPVPGGNRLVFYAADLARSPDGRWWVLSDRTQAPSGMGYALENRVVLSRVFPEVFRSVRTARLGGFFAKAAQALSALAPRPGGMPTVVFLTPGPFNETYFEHAYLARHLGCSLVEGQDLAVRDDHVFIKTLKGLQQVDVILRRVDEEYCDPLELRDDSLLGVPGLMSAVRAGTVVLANALGSGILQAPALRAFLPGLCREILGEDLKIPSVAAWWCGDEAAKSNIAPRLNALAMSRAFDSAKIPPVLDMERELERHGEFYSAHEYVRLSKCPDFQEGRMPSRSIILRVFAVRAGDDYEVMPGGLTRVADGSFSHGVLMQQSGGSKDTWVDIATEDPQAMPALGRLPSNLTSRVADDLFWLGRYAERAEYTARVTRCIFNGLSEEHGWGNLAEMEPLLAVLRQCGQNLEPDSTPDRLEWSLLWQLNDDGNPGCLRPVVRRLREIAMSVRDQMTDDAWRVVNQLCDVVASGPVRSSSDAAAQLSQVVLHIAALHGVLEENMAHGDGWRFVDIGRRIERAIFATQITREVAAPNQAEGPERFENLLDVFDASVTYRQKHALIQPNHVLDLLLCDETNPRSLASQLVRILENLRNLPRDADSRLPEERIVLRALSDVRLFDEAELSVSSARLSDALTSIERGIEECSDRVAQRFFAHLQVSSVGQDTASSDAPVEV